MGLLDDLKKQAETIKQQVKLKEQDLNETLRNNVALVEGKMRQAFKYLNELAKQLNILKPASSRVFDIENAGRFDNLVLNEFFVDYRKKLIFEKEYFDVIIFRFRYSNNQTLVIKKDSNALKSFSDFLWRGNVKHEIQEFKNDHGFVTHAFFKIPCVVRSEIVVKGDYENAQIIFTVRNVERFTEFDLAFNSTAINESLLEELAKYLIGQPNEFRNIGRYINIPKTNFTSTIGGNSKL